MELKCVFEEKLDLSGEIYYTSVIQSISLIKPNTKIRKISGKHVNGKKDEDVKVIKFENTTVNYFPQGLNKIFLNLIAVFIYNCGLKSITRRDLTGLKNLRTLHCSRNKITSLQSNLFQNMAKLKYISFRENDLHCISSDVFKPLSKNYYKIDLRNNRSIDAFYCSSRTPIMDEKHVDSIAQFWTMIDDMCNKNKNISSDRFKDLWKTGLCSDVTIVTETEKFKAHKVVLAVQSSVFASIFDNDMKDRPSGEIHLKNLNADIVKIFIKFFYVGEFERRELAGLKELLNLAEKFKVQNLLSIVEDMIIDDLNDDNAIEVLEFGCRFNCDGIKTSAFEVIQSMFDEPLKDDLINQPEAVTELVEAQRNFKSTLEKYKQI
ncbi:CLUMA_CG016978, isoform A [Clunio marinus]|uniref:CLUMA_CG016978, isoform A n=1 Tax=Clunio marinus TaxID=568069 RepID=A0A1J1IUR6_9DIPT|nr:CLUMA_CG016978, isoform A [Clunio marinus]